ncbi:MAG: hypothetical protein KKD31_13155 [Bacteroidetes bacterium]|nr:hypothetical protein [Bacteroidota bacterium]
MKKTLAVLAIITGIVFLVYKSTFLKFDFATSLILNILGFLPIAIGYAFLRKLLSGGNSKNDQKESPVIEPELKAKMKEPSKKFETEDHERFMPK